MIRHCSMHNINLGFAQVACGSALLLGLNYYMYILITINNLQHHGHLPVLRLLLTELNFFGDLAAMSFQDRLVVAYKDFKAWCRMNKIYCSHGLFTPNSVAQYSN